MLWIDTEKQLKKYFDHGSLPIIVSVDKRHYDEKQYQFLLHGHPDICELTVIVNGAGLYQQGNESAVVKKGDVLLYNCGEVHVTQTIADGGVDYFSIGITNLRKRNLQPDYLRRMEDPFLLHSGDQFPVIQWYCEQLYYLLSRKQKDSFNDLAVQLLGASLIVFLDQLEADDSYKKDGTKKNAEDPAEGPEEKKVFSGNTAELRRRANDRGQSASKKETPKGSDPVQADMATVKAYMDKNYRKALTLAYISSEMGYSETYISHEFKKCYGIAPMKYVTSRRISQAQLLLHSTDMKVTEVARRVGYSNSNYFITLFNKVVGMTPEKYREYIKKDVRRLV